MSKYTGIPFRHDVVGSFLRPQAIHDARRAFEAGTLTKEELRAIENREIKSFYAVGCHYLQLDDTSWGEFCDLEKGKAYADRDLDLNVIAQNM